MKVDVYVASPSTLAKTVDVTGSLLPFEETEIHAEIGGLITGIYFTEGAYVTAGKVLVTLKDDDLRAQLRKLEIQAKTAEQTVRRYGELLEIQGVSKQEYDLNVLSLNAIRADMAIVRTSMAKTRVTAPYSGTMGLRNISKGAYVSPATSISTLRKSGQLKLDFTVPEKYSTKITRSTPIYFTVENNTKQYLAHVTATENFITQDSRSLNVRAVVDQPDASLIPGQFATIEIPLSADYAAYMIPTQAIIPKARTKEILILNNGKTEQRVVTTGIRDSSRIEILTGLKAGDTVILTGLMSIKPGSKVKAGTIKKM